MPRQRTYYLSFWGQRRQRLERHTCCFKFLAPNRRPRHPTRYHKMEFHKVYLEAAGIYLLAARYILFCYIDLWCIPLSVCTYHHTIATERYIVYIAPGTRTTFFVVTRSINFGFNALKLEIRFDEKTIIELC